MAATSAQPLMPGMPAPNFIATTSTGEPISLASYRGRKVWLAFFRHANCPFCHMRVREIYEHQARLRRESMQIIAVFQSPVSSFTASVLRNMAWYPLVSDPNEQLYSLFGLQAKLGAFLAPSNLGALKQAHDQSMLSSAAFKMDGTQTRVPGDFLIDADGVIRDMHYGRTLSDSIPLDRVLSFSDGTGSGFGPGMGHGMRRSSVPARQPRLG